MALHQCKTPAIMPGKQTYSLGYEWTCRSYGCGQVWVAQHLSKSLKLLVWKRK